MSNNEILKEIESIRKNYRAWLARTVKNELDNLSKLLCLRLNDKNKKYSNILIGDKTITKHDINIIDNLIEIILKGIFVTIDKDLYDAVRNKIDEINIKIEEISRNKGSSFNKFDNNHNIWISIHLVIDFIKERIQEYNGVTYEFEIREKLKQLQLEFFLNLKDFESNHDNEINAEDISLTTFKNNLDNFLKQILDKFTVALIRFGKEKNVSELRDAGKRPPSTISDVFIIESLRRIDKTSNRLEGRKIADMLLAIGKNPKYYYFNNQEELKYILKIFKLSKYRYLHVSCHATNSHIEVENDIDLCDHGEISYANFSKLFTGCFDQHRAFFSACELGNDNFFSEIQKHTGLHSIVAPSEKIDFNHSIALWVAFYTAIFSRNNSNMRSNDMLSIIHKLSEIFPVPFKTSIFNSVNKEWKEDS